MTNIKSYTDLEQSKKLEEILPKESADMFWLVLGDTPRVHVLTEPLSNYNRWENYPCWSLAAVLKILPSEFAVEGELGTYTYKIHIRKRKLIDDVDVYQIAYGNYKFYEDGSSSWRDMINTSEEEDLIDAAFEMICWLKESGKI